MITVLESVQNRHQEYEPGRVDPHDPDIAIFIPARGPCERGSRQEVLLGETVKTALACSQVKDVYVLTDNRTTAELAKELGAEVPFLRDPEDCSDDVPIGEVYKRFLKTLQSLGRHPDVIVSLEPNYPNRRKETIEKCIHLEVPGQPWKTLHKVSQFTRLVKLTIPGLVCHPSSGCSCVFGRQAEVRRDVGGGLCQ